MSFQSILAKYQKISFSQRDKGDRFERLMQAFLRTEPRYAHSLKKIWLWSEFPYRADFGGSDTGIDLVAQTTQGDYWAIQCKCYEEGKTIDKGDLDSFLATSSRTFRDAEGKERRFAERLWIDTTGRHFSIKAEEATKNQNPPFIRLSLYELIESPVDWDKLERGVHGEQARTPKKSLLPHQKTALENAHTHYKTAERGQLIMACGTGKTFTSLKIAEHETNGRGTILFLVPSIALLGQALREWSADASEPIKAICICSDPKASKSRKKNDDTDAFSVVDLALPASTDPDFILKQFQVTNQKQTGLTVVFSTYQSIDVIASTQKVLLKNGLPEFDLIICDEAHRTTGVTLAGEDESNFVKVHDASFIKAKKRLYMTATPRLYSDSARSRAEQADAVLCSMDDAALYGGVFYRIGFGKAVEDGLLTDYKVLILTLNDRDVPPAVQKMISAESEINADDVSKLVGCINALSKQFIGDDGKTKEIDPEPMRRAVAFCSTIAASRRITSIFNDATNAYINSLPQERREQMVSIEARHMDGTMSALARDEMLNWVKESTEGNECRILTNVRVLSEGVDVPSLDAVMFLSAKNSQVDVVQSVGRVMRRAPGKNYGYIIIPVVAPSNISPEQALDDNDRYRVVWTVLNALRAHDDRFNATVNKIELNKRKPVQIMVGRPEMSFDADGRAFQVEDDHTTTETSALQGQLAFQFEQLQSVVYARLVQKVGDRRYWEQWAKDVAVIAERQKERIQFLVSDNQPHKLAFEQFVGGLQSNINPSITPAQAVDMLAQHIITQPVFDALFDDYSFVQSNAVSQAMQTMLAALGPGTLTEDSDTLKRFYQSVRQRAEKIDNADGKQRIIIELYDKFFKTAFPKMVEQLGIVYTPIEPVDFILRSIEDILQSEFGRSLSDENIHILDPFAGTGTFVTRLLQGRLIRREDLSRKYKNELHANEIVLLAYYIAAINIENAYHEQMGEASPYEPFEGIVLTDTFQLGEKNEHQQHFVEMFPQNSERVEKQKKAPLRVILGNPPYSVGQRSANDNAQNQKYEFLDSRVTNTYVKESNAGLSKSSYDAYIKAFRWGSDRLDPEHGGVIAFISNAGWLDGNAQDGFRKILEREFSSIWVFNLRGNQRTSGELSRKEGGKIFGGGSRTPIAITFLVKNPNAQTERAIIHYHDIGDYLSREEKLAKIKHFVSVANPEMTWQILQPNEYGDWINQRGGLFETLISIQPDRKFDQTSQSFFNTFAIGVSTNRDAWVYGSSKSLLVNRLTSMIEFYKSQRTAFAKETAKNPQIKVEDFVDSDPKKISWTAALRANIRKNTPIDFDPNCFRFASYRPYYKQFLYFQEDLIERLGLSHKFLPPSLSQNVVICVSASANDGMSILLSNQIPDLHFNGDTQCFPLYYYEEQDKQAPGLWDEEGKEYIRRDGVSDFILERAKKQYGKNVTKEDIFYYVYGFLHSPQYREVFANDLKKQLPRLPLVEDVSDFWKFSKAGRQLADLHVNYENVPAYPNAQVAGAESNFFRVEKMRFSQKGQKDTILFNSKITISNIPDKAYEYVVNGKSGIEWVMERYQVTTHAESGITNDPNDWAEEVGNPRYILDLLLSVINVSVQTVDIVSQLPVIEFS